MHATLLGNHDDAPYTIRSRPGQVEKHANTKPPPGSTGTTPAAPPPGRHHTTTSRKSTHNNTKGSGLNKPPQNPGFDTPAKGHCTRYVALHPLRGDTPVTWRCTRYVALHPLRRAAPVTSRCTRTEGVQCLQIGCNAYTSGAMPTHRVHDPPSQAQMRTCPNGGRRTRQAWLRPAAVHPPQPTAPGGAVQTAGWARRRSPNSWLGPAAQSKQLAGPGDGRAWRGFETTHRAGGSRRRQRAGHRARGSRRCAASSPGASLPRRQGPGRGAHMHQARARRSRGVEARRRGTHATNPGPGRAHDEAGTRRAKQRRGPRPRQQVRPGDPP